MNMIEFEKALKKTKCKTILSFVIENFKLRDSEIDVLLTEVNFDLNRNPKTLEADSKFQLFGLLRLIKRGGL